MNAYKIDTRYGALYDTLMYSSLYFGKDNYLMRMKNNDFEHEYALDPFNAFEQATSYRPSDNLLPFFYYDGIKNNPVSSCYYMKMDFKNPTLASFKEMMKDKQSFLSFFLYWKFGKDYTMNDWYMKNDFILLDDFMKLGDLAKYYINLVYHFDDFYEELCDYLDHMIPIMQKYHEDHLDQYNMVIQKVIQEETMLSEFFKRELSEPDFDFHKQVYSASLIHPYAVHWDKIEGDVYTIVLGTKYAKQYILLENYRYLSVESIAKVLASPINVAILDCLKEGPKSAAEIEKELKIKHTTVYRYINNLANEYVIFMTNNRKYRLNRDYFEVAAKKMGHKLKDLY